MNMLPAPVNILTLKWGRMYSAEYVNRIYRGVKRHLHRPFRFVCVTDDPSGLDDGIDAQPLPEKPEWFRINARYPAWPNIYLKLFVFQRYILFRIRQILFSIIFLINIFKTVGQVQHSVFFYGFNNLHTLFFAYIFEFTKKSVRTVMYRLKKSRSGFLTKIVTMPIFILFQNSQLKKMGFVILLT